MRKAKQQDKNLVIKILSQSFEDNKSVNYIFKKKGNKKKMVYNLMDYSFDLGLKKGEIFINDQNNACAIIMFPGNKGGIWELYKNIKLIYNVIGIKNISRVTNKEKSVSKHHPKTEFAHLWYIGVENEFQGTGLGTSFLGEINNYYKEKGLHVYLETSTERNIPFYQKNGYEVFYTNNSFGFKFYHLKN